MSIGLLPGTVRLPLFPLRLRNIISKLTERRYGCRIRLRGSETVQKQFCILIDIRYLIGVRFQRFIKIYLGVITEGDINIVLAEDVIKVRRSISPYIAHYTPVLCLIMKYFPFVSLNSKEFLNKVLFLLQTYLNIYLQFQKYNLVCKFCLNPSK